MYIRVLCSHLTPSLDLSSNQSDYHRQHYITLTASFIFIVLYWLFRFFLCSLLSTLDAIIKADVIRTVPLALYSSSSSSLATPPSSSSSSVPSSTGTYVAGSEGIHSIRNGLSSSSSPLALAGVVPSSVTGPLVEKSNLPNDFYIGPYLDGNEMTNITVQKGTNAYLPCKVFIYVYNMHLWLLLLPLFVRECVRTCAVCLYVCHFLCVLRELCVSLLLFSLSVGKISLRSYYGICLRNKGRCKNSGQKLWKWFRFQLWRHHQHQQYHNIHSEAAHVYFHSMCIWNANAFQVMAAPLVGATISRMGEGNFIEIPLRLQSCNMWNSFHCCWWFRFQ